MIKEQKEPDELLRSFWALNDKYPDYVTCVRFDGASAPYHDMDEVKALFKSILLKNIGLEIYLLNEKIEIAEEKGESILPFLEQRKILRDLKYMDLSPYHTIEELHALLPETLKPYWRK